METTRIPWAEARLAITRTSKVRQLGRPAESDKPLIGRPRTYTVSQNQWTWPSDERGMLTRAFTVSWWWRPDVLDGNIGGANGARWSDGWGLTMTTYAGTDGIFTARNRAVYCGVTTAKRFTGYPRCTDSRRLADADLYLIKARAGFIKTGR